MPRKKTSRKKKEQLSEWQLPLEQLCCVNSDCEVAGQRGQGNLAVRTGKGRGKWRILRCSKCRTEFSERKGTPLWGTTMPPERAAAIANHLAEGCGIRKSSRLTGASKNGVTSIGKRLGFHAVSLHDERALDLDVSEAQFDEKWSFVEKKQKQCDDAKPEDALAGDQWDHTAVDVESRFVVSLTVGKRTSESLVETVADFAERTGGAPPS
jgi:transposase-like protein